MSLYVCVCVCGGGGGKSFISNTYSLHCHHQNDSAWSWAVVWAILMFHWLCGQSHKTVSINHSFSREEKGELRWIEPRSFCLPAKRLTARPHQLTFNRRMPFSCSILTTVHAHNDGWFLANEIWRNDKVQSCKPVGGMSIHLVVRYPTLLLESIVMLHHLLRGRHLLGGVEGGEWFIFSHLPQLNQK